MRVRLEVEDGIATVTLVDPGGHNQLDLPASREVAAAVAAAEQDPGARVILLRAEGTAFCAGGSLDSFEHAGADVHDEVLRVFEALNPTIRLLHETPKITIAAAHGAVAGGGLGLMAAADVVLLARGTVLTLAYEPLAASPDMGVSWFLPRDIGYRRALALYLSSERIDAEQALDLGLVTYVVDDEELEGRSRELARTIAHGPHGAHAATKRLLRQATETPLERQLEDESRSFADNTRLPDFRAGVAAFLSRRAARSKGRGAGA